MFVSESADKTLLTTEGSLTSGSGTAHSHAGSKGNSGLVQAGMPCQQGTACAHGSNPRDGHSSFAEPNVLP